MSRNTILDGMDVAWLASDARGNVAVFTTAGQGPIPKAAMASVEEAESEVVALPEICDCRLHVSLPRPDDFLAFARRGFFAYDWSDVHRTESQSLHKYELLAEPSTPAQLAALPVAVHRLVVCLPNVSFGASLVAVGT